jgi:hypothetical protein
MVWNSAVIRAILKCAASAELLSSREDRPLRWTESLALMTHLAMCVKCRRYRTQLIAIRMLLAVAENGPVQITQSDEQVLARIRAALHAVQVKRIPESGG